MSATDRQFLVPVTGSILTYPTYFLTVASIASVIQSAISNGIFPAIISTIELLYGLTSTQAGFIIAFYDIVSLVAVILIISRAHNAHRPQWIAVGEAALISGCILAIVPNYMAHTTLALLVFLAAQAALALAGAPLYPLATTFIFDNAPKRSISVYLGIFNAMTAIGLALGFIVAGAFLHQSTNYWPYAFVLFGILAVLVAPTIYYIPNSLFLLQTHTYTAKPAFLTSCRAILSVGAFTFTQLGFAIEAIVVVGLANFMPKYAQIRFNFSPATASFVIGPLILISAILGILGGGIISRNWHQHNSARNVAICASLALCTAPCFLISTPQIFLPLFFLLVAFTMLINVPASLFCLRCILNEDHRALSLAIGSSLQRIIGATSGPIAVGAIIDSACTAWDTACLAYDSDTLAIRIFIFVVVLKAASTVFFIGANYCHVPTKLATTTQTLTEMPVFASDAHTAAADLEHDAMPIYPPDNPYTHSID